MIARPLLPVANATVTMAALLFHGGVQHNQEVKDHDLNCWGEHIVVVPVNDAVIFVAAIVAGIGGGGGGAMRSLPPPSPPPSMPPQQFDR